MTYEPTSSRKQGRRVLTSEQQAIADELARRAAEMWSESDGELSIAEAVEFAAFRMGVELPQTITEFSEEA